MPTTNKKGRRKLYRYKNAVVFATKRNTSEMLDVSRGYPGFRSYRHLLGWWEYRTERKAKAKAREIFLRHLEMMAIDIVDNGDVFLLPERETGVIYVGDPREVGVPVDPRFAPIEYDQKAADGIISLCNIFRASIGRGVYRLTLLQVWRQRIAHRRENHNMRYS